MQNHDWYDTPLYYDIVFDQGTTEEAEFLEVMNQRHGTGTGRRSSSLLEPACGSGRLIREMARRGWRVAGFDTNPHTLDFARARIENLDRRVRLWEDRLESFTVPGGRRFELAHCLVSTFKYLKTEADALACLQRVAACLKPGGIFVLGLHLTDYANTRWLHERWVTKRGRIEVVCNTRTWPADRKKRLEDLRCRLKITIGGRTGRIRTQESRWQFRSYNAAQMRRLLRKVPELTLVACHDFHYDPDSPRKLDDSYSDVVMVLRRGESGV